MREPGIFFEGVTLYKGASRCIGDVGKGGASLLSANMLGNACCRSMIRDGEVGLGIVIFFCAEVGGVLSSSLIGGSGSTLRFRFRHAGVGGDGSCLATVTTLFSFSLKTCTAMTALCPGQSRALWSSSGAAGQGDDMTGGRCGRKLFCRRSRAVMTLFRCAHELSARPVLCVARGLLCY